MAPAEQGTGDHAPVKAHHTIVARRARDRRRVHTVTVPLRRHLLRSEEHQVAVQSRGELGVVVAQQPSRRVAPQPGDHISLELIDRRVVHAGAQITEKPHRRDVVRTSQGGRVGHHQPVAAAGARVLEHVGRRPPARPGPGLAPQPPEHPVHDCGVGQGALGIGEGARRQPFLSRKHLITLHGPTVRRAHQADNVPVRRPCQRRRREQLNVVASSPVPHQLGKVTVIVPSGLSRQ